MAPLKWTSESLLTRFAEVHHGKGYTYPGFVYTGMRNRIRILCPKHGEFTQSAYHHLNGTACPDCYRESKVKWTAEMLKARFAELYNGKYVYPDLESHYKTTADFINAVCPIHGIFSVRASEHLHLNRACPDCATPIVTDPVTKERRTKRRKVVWTTESLVTEFTKIHNGYYTYPNTIYAGMKCDLEIECPRHGSFWQKAEYHLQGNGCEMCANERIRKFHASPIHYDYDLFVEASRFANPREYIYPVDGFDPNDAYVTVICKEHGPFRTRKNSHTQGHGCPSCKSSANEIVIGKYLDSQGISYETQKRFDGCRNINLLPFDFYLPDHGILIEYHGKQHYQPIEYFGGNEGFALRCYRDAVKEKYARDRGYYLIVIPYTEIDVQGFLRKALDPKCKGIQPKLLAV